MAAAGSIVWLLDDVSLTAPSLFYPALSAACFSYIKNYNEVIHIARWVQLRYQFQTQGLRLLLALVPGGSWAIEAFNSNPLQKFLIRQLRIIDAIARGAPTKVAFGGTIVLAGEHAGNKEDEDEAGEGDGVANNDVDDAAADDAALPSENRFLPTKCNPVYNLAYGQLLTVSRSYGSAISECSKQQFQDSRPDPTSLSPRVQSTCSERTSSRRSNLSCPCRSASRTCCAPCRVRRTTGIIRLHRRSRSSASTGASEVARVPRSSTTLVARSII